MTARRIALHGVLVAGAVAFAFPLAWTVSVSLKPPAEYYSSDPSLLPIHPSLQHYAEALFPGLTQAPRGFEGDAAETLSESMLRPLWNSFMTAGLEIPLVLLLAVPAGYALARYPFRGERAVIPGLILMRTLPAVTLAIPLYVVATRLRVLDTTALLVIVYATANLPLAILILRGAFKTIPADLHDSALIDGCTPLEAFARVELPLAAGGIVAASLLVLALSWSEFTFASFLANNAARTVPVALAQGREILWGSMSAAVVMSAIPLVAIVMLAHKHLVGGAGLEAIK